MPKKLTLEEVKNKLANITNEIEIIDTEYKGNKIPLKCKCKKCDYVWSAKWNNLSSNKSGCPECYLKSKPISEEVVIDTYLNNNYDVIKVLKSGISDEYRLLVKCDKGHEHESSYSSFKSGRRCKICSNARASEAKKNSKEKVESLINSLGFKLADDSIYEGNKTPFKVICEKGHTTDVIYNTASRKGIVCKQCKYGRESVKYSEDDIRKALSEIGLTYISGFKNTDEKFKFRCECGNIGENRLHDLRRGFRCRECSDMKVYTYEEVRDVFKEGNCELLVTKEEYTNTTVKLKYLCECNTIKHILFSDFRNGRRCFTCRSLKYSGENHPNWNPTLTENERLKNRKYKEYTDWRNSVFKRDNYTCQCCGDNKGGNLEAHHLDSYDWAKDKRIDIENGRTLCDICHKAFHLEYGYGNNTREQFEEYMNNHHLTNNVS